MALPVSSSVTRIEPQSGTSLRLRAGQILRIVALEPEQVADVTFFDSADSRNRFSAARTIDYNNSLDVAPGSVLFSNRSTELGRVVADSVGVNDLLLAPCSKTMFERRGEFDHHSCHENLYAALAPFGVAADDIDNTVNVFMDVRVSPDRRILIHPPPSRPGDYFEVQALIDLIVAITACSSELTNAGRCKAIGYEVIGRESAARG